MEIKAEESARQSGRCWFMGLINDGQIVHFNESYLRIRRVYFMQLAA